MNSALGYLERVNLEDDDEKDTFLRWYKQVFAEAAVGGIADLGDLGELVDDDIGDKLELFGGINALASLPEPLWPPTLEEIQYWVDSVNLVLFLFPYTEGLWELKRDAAVRAETLLKYLAEDYNPYGYDITREEYAEQLEKLFNLIFPVIEAQDEFALRDALTALNLEQPIYPSAMEDYLEAIQDDVAKDAGESRLKKDPDTVDPYYSVEDIIQAIDAIIKEVNDGYFGQFFCFDVEVAKARVLQKDMEDECGITLNIQALNGYGEPYLGFNEDWDVYMLVTIGEDKADGAKLLLENGAAEVTFFDSDPSLPGWPAYIDVPEGANNEPFTEIAEWVIAQATFYVVPPEELDGAEVMEYPYAIGPFSIEAVPTHLGITVVTDQEEGTPTFKSDELMEFKLQLFYEVYQGEAGVAGVQNQDQEFKLVTTYYDEHDVQIGIGPNIDNLFDVWFAGGEATVWVWAGQQTADEGANVHVVIDGLNLEAKDIVNVIITAADPDHLCAEWDEAGNITLEVHDHRSQVVKAVDDKKVHLWMLVGPLGDASGMTALNGGTDPFAVPDEEGDVRVTFKNGEATILFANSPFQDWLDMRMTQEGIDEVTLVIISLDPDLAITPAELKYPAN